MSLRLWGRGTMTSDALRVPSFWPSRRVWLKLLLALICGPSLVGGTFFVLAAAFSGMGPVTFFGYETTGALIGIFGLTLVVGGPTIMALYLSPNALRGVGSAMAALMAAVLIGFLISEAVFLTSRVGPIVFAALIVGGQIAVLELVSNDVRGWHGAVGLWVGVLIGLVLSLALAIQTGSADLLFRGEERIVLPMSVFSSIIWLSGVVFPELFTRRVGWGGLIVWAALVVIVSATTVVIMM